MGMRLWLQMGRRYAASDGFTMLEMMLTLCIISVLMLLSVVNMPSDKGRNIDHEIETIGYFLQSAQTGAMGSSIQQIVEMDRLEQRLLIRGRNGRIIRTHPLDTCKLKPGGLERVIFKSNGDTDKFGTISFDCLGRSVSFIFQIQRGRFRIEG